MSIDLLKADIVQFDVYNRKSDIVQYVFNPTQIFNEPQYDRFYFRVPQEVYDPNLSRHHHNVMQITRMIAENLSTIKS